MPFLFCPCSDNTSNQKTFNLACVFSLRNKVTRKSLFSYLKSCRLVQRRTASELANDKTPTSVTEKETQTSNINNLQTGMSFGLPFSSCSLVQSLMLWINPDELQSIYWVRETFTIR
jgi:hypothetical protein